MIRLGVDFEVLEEHEVNGVRVIEKVRLLAVSPRPSQDPESTIDEVKQDMDMVFDDLRAILRALGLFDGARPISAHEVVHSVIIPEIKRLRGDI